MIAAPSSKDRTGIRSLWMEIYPTRGECVDEAIAATRATLKRLLLLKEIHEREVQGKSGFAAADLAGVSWSTALRWWKDLEEKGVEGLLNKRRTVKLWGPCSLCTGSGQHPTDAHLRCLQCNGRGEVRA